MEIGNNEISFLPDSIDALENLKIFDILGNPIQKIPKSILNLKFLTELIVGVYKLNNMSQQIIEELEHAGIKIF